MADQPPTQGSEEVRQAVEAVRRAVEALEAESDPAVRGKEASDLLKAWTDEQPVLRKMRHDAVRALREQKVSYRNIAKALGVSLARVQQIEAGETTTGRGKKRTDPPTD